MKPTDFSKYISDFIIRYLPDERGASVNTITAYRDTFVLLLDFIEKEKLLKVEKLTLAKIKKETIIEFLDWIQKERKCSDSTRNMRLAAIHSFYRYLQYENLDNLHECQKVLSIRSKKTRKESITYLSIEGIRLLLQQPDTTTTRGRRDLALLSLTYDTGARVQEIIDLTPSRLRLGKPPVIKIIGKGNRVRLVPMLDAQIIHLKNYMEEHRLDQPTANIHPLFFNSRKEKFTRAGINHILHKYMDMARKADNTLIPDKASCHSFRHSKAMHLLQAGVNLVYIRDILGHVSVQTTEIYARADSRQKRKALENAYVDINPDEEPVWTKNENLISWLKRF
ncbi:phage integrase family protein [Christiangramia forsetii KT0803]|uniref:Phage integrase family protein n=3 Tax=Christiangramia forsetii TaxID=411153 RepID=A0M0R0_CHRFK|nr:site-specific integrase [Christiangramia forsetii]CAL66205.1 phage integrase family protein [Christiangramia forsetii KT0803]CAL66325.1 phage integrase family protein [Christiangramia forsetii KT0803]